MIHLIFGVGNFSGKVHASMRYNVKKHQSNVRLRLIVQSRERSSMLHNYEVHFIKATQPFTC